MPRSVEVSGKSLEEALERAARYFDVPTESLNYEIVSENRGFLSAFTPRVVKVRVWIEETSLREAPQEEPKDEPLPEVSISQVREELEKFFKELMDKMEMKVDFQIEEQDGSLFLSAEGEDAGMLIGKGGETLEALETILWMAMSKKGFGSVNIQIDVSGYREKREKTLKKLAERSAQKVIKERRRLKLEPMSARERKIIHTSLKDYPEVTTYSIGEGAGRRVVIDLKREGDRRRSGGNRKSSGR